MINSFCCFYCTSQDFVCKRSINLVLVLLVLILLFLHVNQISVVCPLRTQERTSVRRSVRSPQDCCTITWDGNTSSIFTVQLWWPLARSQVYSGNTCAGAIFMGIVWTGARDNRPCRRVSKITPVSTGILDTHVHEPCHGQSIWPVNTGSLYRPF